jgi:hypothetical protein
MTTKLALLGAAAVAAIGLVAAPPAGATTPTPLTLNETITFGDGHAPPVGLFTADGLPACRSGSFEDQLVNFNFGGQTLVIDRVYFCDNGTDAFLARMVLHNSPPDQSGIAVADGQWTIHDGIGSLAALRGEGTTYAVNSGCTPPGSLFFTCESGVSDVDASIH